MNENQGISNNNIAFDIGCCFSDIDKMFEAARGLGRGKKVCAIQEWEWWDLTGIPSHLLREECLQPAMIYSDNVIIDSAMRFPKGACIRTSLIVRLHLGCVVETRNTLYILVGIGVRKRLDYRIALI